LNGSIADLRWESSQTLSLITLANSTNLLYLGEVSDSSLKLTPSDSATGTKFIAISNR
jgi:hypothetical protein